MTIAFNIYIRHICRLLAVLYRTDYSNVQSRDLTAELKSQGVTDIRPVKIVPFVLELNRH
jgi:hypothetical protein